MAEILLEFGLDLLIHYFAYHFQKFHTFIGISAVAFVVGIEGRLYIF